ncbi:MAG: hypothetical protein A3K13_03625 [Gemmatimonadetes bacterium RIFCSPLOWO2_12_FULL_68_9]|nr:MAG: hypothetical protein A3K13_03625 [Gemmatimonadetes bacterium RIFCSPLOWO2_12_FULL_68_9]
MRRISFWHLAFGFSAAATVGAVSGCGDPFGQEATIENAVDTVILYALRDTPIRLPSAYDMFQLSGSQAVRTDTTSQFDFAFDIDSAGRALIYPAGALGLSREPGLQLMDKRFDEVRRAPDTGYRADSAMTVTQGNVFVARSRVTSLLCVYVSVPRYGKFHVLSLDTTNRSITLETLVDLNCGFRGLEPGIPGS